MAAIWQQNYRHRDDVVVLALPRGGDGRSLPGQEA